MPSTGTGSLPYSAWPRTAAEWPHCAVRLSAQGKRPLVHGRLARKSGASEATPGPARPDGRASGQPEQHQSAVDHAPAPALPRSTALWCCSTKVDGTLVLNAPAADL